MPIEKRPSNPLPPNFVPFGGLPYKVGDQDSWVTCSQAKDRRLGASRVQLQNAQSG